MSFFNNFNLTNTSVGNFFKGAAGNIGSFLSGTTDKVSGFLGVGDSYQGPKIPKSKGIDEDFLQNILDYDALLKAIEAHGTEVTGEMYRNWYQYWQESQNDLKPRFNNDYLRQ